MHGCTNAPTHGMHGPTECTDARMRGYADAQMHEATRQKAERQEGRRTHKVRSRKAALNAETKRQESRKAERTRKQPNPRRQGTTVDGQEGRRADSAALRRGAERAWMRASAAAGLSYSTGRQHHTIRSRPSAPRRWTSSCHA